MKTSKSLKQHFAAQSKTAAIQLMENEISGNTRASFAASSARRDAEKCGDIAKGDKNPLRLPWRIVGTEFHGFGVVNCEGATQIAAKTLNLAQASAIVRGVNHHADLLAAVKLCENVIGMAVLRGDLSDNALSPHWDALRAARAVIAKAKGTL